jgi:predicted small metal-binding protein
MMRRMASTSEHEPGDWAILCFCGHKVRGETDVELLSNARNHIDEAHPDREGQTDEELLARAEKQSA